MEFIKINRNAWIREEYFEHYISRVPCTYSMTVKLDITALKSRGQKLYPAMLYYLSTIVNRHPEFRTSFNKQGELGIYSEMVPSYTVFHKDTETFSELWTVYKKDYESFCSEYEKDILQYGNCKGLTGKPDVPENVFPVSMIPWFSFEGFNLNLKKDGDYLLPIFTMGKYYEENGRIKLPLAVQVHHAVCDGFHVCRFITELQELIENG